MKWSKTKTAQWFLIYYIISFVAAFVLLNSPNLFNSSKKTPKISKFSVDNNFCNAIDSVSTSGEKIVVNFKPDSKVKSSDATFHFSLETSWSGKNIFFPPGSSNITEEGNNYVKLWFFLPMVDKYTATLQCSNPDSLDIKTSSEIKPIKTFSKLKLEATELSSSWNFSRFRCHGDDFLTRWCEGRNIPYFDNCFFFLSPAIFTFPEPFLVPGPRAPPFDKEIDRLVSEPIVIQFNKYNIPRNITTSYGSKMVYIYGTYYNYYMLWHQMFDFIVPFYKFVHEINKNETANDRVIFVKSDGVWQFFSLINAISSEPVRIIEHQTTGMIFPNVIMGIKKYENDIRLSRTYEESIAFKYNFDETSAPTLRDDTLKANKISTENVGEEGKPLIVIIDRGMTKRNIQNQGEVEDYLRKACPFCKVRSLALERYSVDKQVEIISRSSVLLGLHGSGLANCLWMAASRPNHTTHMIEFLPYNYSCRDWYHTAARVARVNYYPLMNKEPNWKTADRMSFCWAKPSRCPTIQCHDLLRDQPFSVEIQTLDEVFSKIVLQLNSTIPVGNVTS